MTRLRRGLRPAMATPVAQWESSCAEHSHDPLQLGDMSGLKADGRKASIAVGWVKSGVWAAWATIDPVALWQPST